MTNFAVTAWAFALVKCTNVPKGQLRMCLVGGGREGDFFFSGELPFPTPPSLQAKRFMQLSNYLFSL